MALRRSKGKGEECSVQPLRCCYYILTNGAFSGDSGIFPANRGAESSALNSPDTMGKQSFLESKISF